MLPLLTLNVAVDLLAAGREVDEVVSKEDEEVSKEDEEVSKEDEEEAVVPEEAVHRDLCP